MTFASGKQVNLACGELKVNNILNHHWYETSLLATYIANTILKHVVSRNFIVKNLAHVPSSVDCIQVA